MFIIIPPVTSNDERAMIGKAIFCLLVVEMKLIIDLDVKLHVGGQLGDESCMTDGSTESF